MVGAQWSTPDGYLSSFLGLPGVESNLRACERWAAECLERAGISHLAPVPVATLAPGDGKRLELARALSLRPQLLLLDEIAQGLSSSETEAFLSLLRELRSEGMSILLIDHDMDLVMRAAESVLVLHHGRRVAEGAPEKIQCHPAVINVYLGEAEQQGSG